MTGPYDDIINLPHHVSDTHPHMSMADRAAQFSPFAALTGYGDAVRETARLTDQRIELDENAKAELNEKLQAIADRLDTHPAVDITYFQPDEKKAGGAYVMVSGRVKKIDGFEHAVVLQDGQAIAIADIIKINREELCDMR